MLYLGGDKEMKKLLARGNHNKNRHKKQLKNGKENIEGRRTRSLKACHLYNICGVLSTFKEAKMLPVMLLFDFSQRYKSMNRNQ